MHTSCDSTYESLTHELRTRHRERTDKHMKNLRETGRQADQTGASQLWIYWQGLLNLMIVVIVLSASLAGQSSSRGRILLHVTSVREDDTPEYCRDSVGCHSTSFLVEARSVIGDGIIEYKLECTDLIVPRPTPHFANACVTVHAGVDYLATLIGGAVSIDGPELAYAAMGRTNIAAYTIVSEMAASRPDSPVLQPAGKDNEQPRRSFGTGFFVSREGYILTNDHVVAPCKTLTTRDGQPLQIVAHDVSADLALVKANVSPSNVAVFRTGAPPRIGDSVVVFGFPLPGFLSSEGNVTTGVLSATTGIQDDVRLLQMTAPIQSGNSGGPVLDRSGHVIGVVVAKLDVLQMARVTGDIAQNVNFAVHWSTVRSFLDERGVHYRKDSLNRTSSTANVARSASRMSVTIECSE